MGRNKMNERIKELAEQSYEDFQTLTSPKYLVFNKEKFAELIIQKCISQIALIGVSNFKNEDIMWTVETAIASIKEHFGVEE
jgi:hypothetical protein